MAKAGRKRKFLRIEPAEDNSNFSFRKIKTRSQQMHLDSQMRIKKSHLEALASKKNDTKLKPPLQIVIDISESGNESKEDDSKQNPSMNTDDIIEPHEQVEQISSPRTVSPPLITCKGGVNSPESCGKNKGDVNGGLSSRSGEENLSHIDLQSMSSCQSNFTGSEVISSAHHKADMASSFQDDEIENNVSPDEVAEALRFSRYSFRLRKQKEETQKYNDTEPTGSTFMPCLRERSRKLESIGVAKITRKEDLSDNSGIPVNEVILSEVPTSTRKLLSTGFLEGYSVQYVHHNELLLGRIVGEGILCQCSICKGQVVVNLTNFEKHAGSGAKRPSDYIRFENGVNFTQLVNIICNTALHNIPNVIKSTLEIVSSESSPESNCIKPRQLPIKHHLDPITESTVQEISPGKRKVSTSTFREYAGVCDNPKRRRGRSPSKNLNGIPGHAMIGRTPTNSVGKSDHVKRGRGRPPKIILDLEPSEKYPGDNNTPSSSKKPKETSLHKLLFMPFGLPDGTELAYYMKGQHFLNGYKEGCGIKCCCCNKVVSCSQFEVHAGWGNRKSPYKHIYLSDGRSLHEAALSIANDRRHCENRYLDPSLNDDYCAVCGDGGDLILCDGCPKSFHTECLGLARNPPGEWWFCSSCRRCSVTHGKTSETEGCNLSVNVERHASKGKSSERQTRVVNKVTNNSYSGCILCRSEDFTKYGFGERTILFCDQCEKEFHVGCLRTHSIADLKELPKGKWFCCHDCREIHSGLQKHVAGASKTLPMKVSEELRKKVKIDGEKGLQDEIRWQILHGKTKNPESKELLSEAAAIFNDCFDPILDPCTGRDLIPLMLYSQSMRDQEFGGMYSAVLTVNSEVVSVAVFRVLGRQAAELPLVATKCTSQGQGYFQSLFSCIVELLGSLNIEHIVLPAADEAESFWTKKFGFMKMSGEQFHEFTKDLQLTAFKGASMLGKAL